MEGLIPLVCKAIKRNTTRRRYECLSGGITQRYEGALDFYSGDQTHQFSWIAAPSQQKIPGGAHEENYGNLRQLDRRYSSVRDYASRLPPEGDNRPRKQLVRFRSQKLLSCVTGGA